MVDQSKQMTIANVAARVLDAFMALSLVAMLFIAPTMAERQVGEVDAHATFLTKAAN